MKYAIVSFLMLFISIDNGHSQEQPEDEAARARSRDARPVVEKEREKTDVMFFKPRVITPDWSVVLATVKTLTPDTPEKMQIDQFGKVTLNVNKVLYGKPLSEITLPYRYNNLAIFKSKDTQLRKRFKYDNFPQDLVWPDLTILKQPYLLVVINPHAIDCSVVDTGNPNKTQTLAAKVFETKGADDPHIIDLLKKIPK